MSEDLLTKYRDNVIQGRGGDVPQDRHWVFHLEFTWKILEMF